MKQIFQYLDSGKTKLIELPPPRLERGEVLIRSKFSLISSGTERMLINFGKSNLISKAKNQPEKVSEVISKIKSEGVFNTLDAVSNKLDKPLPLGYCNAGTIVEVGEDVTSFKVGDRVVSNGFHAELVTVSENLCALIPDEVSFEEASFTVIAAVGLQGIRLLKPTLGETIAVSGLGVVGLITCQLLLANGCKVLGLDPDQSKCELANILGVETFCISNKSNPSNWCLSKTKGIGVDGFLVTASTTSSDPIYVAANSSRKRGRIVLIGVTGLDLKRELFYKKELTFQVSCSYGPGRYDKNYEEKNEDYPIGYVRWTEKRNFEAILDLMEKGHINIDALISYRYKFEEAVKAYQHLNESEALGITLSYDNKELDNFDKKTKLILKENHSEQATDHKVSFVGGGNYASRVLIPLFRKRTSLHTLVTNNGINSTHHGKKNGFLFASSSIDDLIEDNSNIGIVATQHNLHANQTIFLLNNHKNVFVEKPLALTLTELDDIKKALNNSNGDLMVGYNRRFAPQTKKIKNLLQSKTGPKTIIMTMNAGMIPDDHWTQDKKTGGGRIIGEACHYIDLMRFIVGHKITSYNAIKISPKSNTLKITSDKSIINLEFDDGSIGTINYFANGDKSYPKEKITIFCDNSILELTNFIKLKAYGFKKFKKYNLWRQDKGQKNMIEEFLKFISKKSSPPIPYDEIFEVSEASIRIAKLLED